MSKVSDNLVLDLIEVGADDVGRVGGKGANLGELYGTLTKRGVRAVDGFATTSEVYRRLLETDGLGERLRELMLGLDYDDMEALNRAGRETRARLCWILRCPWKPTTRLLMLTGVCATAQGERAK
jgi:pyruvate,water dikinase